MSAAVARTLAAVHATWGEDAVYVPPVGSPVPGLKVVVKRETDAEDAGGGSFVRKYRRTIEVSTAALATPVKGGIFQLAGGQAAIVADPQIEDPAGLVWTCLCRMGS